MKVLSVGLVFLHFTFVFSEQRDASSIDVRVIGGQNVSIFDHPYQAAIESVSGHTLRCGGVIIARTWILTHASDCIIDKHEADFVVRIGTTYKELGGTIHNISRFNYHPDYSFDTYDYDIALIKLSEPITISVTAQVIDLPDNSEDVPEEETAANITGWGVTSDAAGTYQVLQVAQVPILSHSVCKDLYATLGRDVTDRMICAGLWDGGVDSCSLDYGGPLVVDGKLFGISSWGIDCGVAQQPGVYTSVGAVRDWITEVTGI